MTDDETQAEGSSEALRSRLELVAVVLLSVTTILTAWSAFQSSKWGGAMSISFAQASTARIEAARLGGEANQRTAVLVGLWTQWLDEAGRGSETAEFIEARFPEPLATAHADWLATDPFTAPDAPASPFAMPSYVVDEQEQAEEADARADEKYQEALANNQRGDNYTVLTVLFATVLFFTAMSGRVRSTRSQVILLGFAAVLWLVGVLFLIGFPKLV